MNINVKFLENLLFLSVYLFKILNKTIFLKKISIRENFRNLIILLQARICANGERFRRSSIVVDCITLVF
jgi:hypothetical protein